MVLHDSQVIVLWRQGFESGAQWAPFDSLVTSPCWFEGFTNVPAGHYVAVARNGRGNGCWFDQPVDVLPADVTGVPVEDETAGDPVVRCRLFDVQGRWVRDLPGSDWNDRARIRRDRGLARGVYWLSGVTASGRATVARKVVVVR